MYCSHSAMGYTSDGPFAQSVATARLFKGMVHYHCYIDSAMQLELMLLSDLLQMVMTMYPDNLRS